MLTVVVHSFFADDAVNTDPKNPIAKYYDPDLTKNGVVLGVPGPKPDSPTTFWVLFKQSLPPDLKVGDELEISLAKKEAS